MQLALSAAHSPYENTHFLFRTVAPEATKMRIFIFLFCFSLLAQDKLAPYPKPNPGGVVAHESDIKALKEHVTALEQKEAQKPSSPTVEQLQAQIAAKDQQIAKLQQHQVYWSNRAVLCEAAPNVQQTNTAIDAQIDAQAKQPSRSAPVKPEAK